MRRRLLAAGLLCAAATAAVAQINVGIGISVPGVNIGINVPAYPRLDRVPGFPVYYAPALPANFFFYDGLYWVYQGDSWYASTWYNGPWGRVDPAAMPSYLLRVPVRYYRSPPAYFGGWRPDAAPAWGEHWGNDWAQRHNGWNQHDRRTPPAPAPPPTYQRRYPGERYPQQIERQQELHRRNYPYQPRDPVVRQHVQPQAPSDKSTPEQRQPPSARDRPREGDEHRR